jgi:hypothetical protein
MTEGAGWASGGTPLPGDCECLKRHDHQQPLALVIVDGGIAEEWWNVGGCGTPEVHILDMDRGDESAKELREFVDHARETVAIFAARGVDTTGLDEEIADIIDHAEALEAHDR